MIPQYITIIMLIDTRKVHQERILHQERIFYYSKQCLHPAISHRKWKLFGYPDVITWQILLITLSTLFWRSTKNVSTQKSICHRTGVQLILFMTARASWLYVNSIQFIYQKMYKSFHKLVCTGNITYIQRPNTRYANNIYRDGFTVMI